MKITTFELENYKSFNKGPLLSLNKIMNVVVGQNNSGKSALLEPLSLDNWRDTPHNSPGVQEPIPGSRAEVSLTFTWNELEAEIVRSGGTTIPQISSSFPSPAETLQFIVNQGELTTAFRMRPGDSRELLKPSHGISSLGEANVRHFSVTVDQTSRSISGVSEWRGGHSDGLSDIMWSMFRRRRFYFAAERLKVAATSPQAVERLKEDASNLPVVLHELQANPDLMDEFLDRVQRIVPTIRRVSVQFDQGLFRILVQPTFISKNRNYSVPLSQSGTGVAQVLAIAYVIISSEYDIIAIDEPSSFLHPRASKELVSLMHDYDKQYIISTHSTEVMREANATSIFAVSKPQYTSKVDRIESSDFSELREVLSELGSSLSDVYGFDIVIWVEGETERDCFPILARHFDSKLLVGLEFAPMRTSELTAKSRWAEIAADLHTRVAALSAVMPAGTIFCFDSEERNGDEKRALNKKLSGRARFLPRRMYECYLLNPEAISRAIQEVEGAKSVSSSEVEIWLSKHVTDWKNPAALIELDAAKLLERLYDDLAITKYRKTRDSLSITRHIIERDPAALREIFEFIKEAARSAHQQARKTGVDNSETAG